MPPEDSKAPPPGKKGLRRWLTESFSHIPPTLGLVWRSSPGGTLALGLLTVLAAVTPITIAYVGKLLFDAVVAARREEALRWVWVEFGLIAGQALVSRTLGFCRSQLGARLALDINVLILEKAQTLSLPHFEDAEFYDQLTRARREASSRPISVISDGFQLLQNGLTLAGYAAVLSQVSGLVVLGLLVAAVPAALVEMKFSGAAFRLRNWRSPEARRQIYLEYLLANDGHAKEVQLFGLGPLLLGRYKAQGETFYREDLALARRRAFWAYLLSLLGAGAFYGAYGWMVASAAVGAITLGALTLYVAAFRQGQQAFQSILGSIGGMFESNLYMSNLFSFLAIDVAKGLAKPSRRGAPAEAAPAPRVEPRPEIPARGLYLDGVGFQYPGQEKYALRGLTLAIPEGQSLALVGHNGAGKTTLIKLLTRLYEPTEGRILLDGKDLREWEPHTLRARYAVVFQDFNEYQMSARENVGLGSVPHLDDAPRVTRAVGRGGAEEVIAKLSQGLDTQLGRWFKGGQELSGGQWQKVALARAFMREEADILILDEPTAALDAEAEHAVFARFRELSKGRTSIVISHRFPTVRMADRIVVIEGGEVVEQGGHDALLAAGGRYAKLFQLQAQGYL